MVPAAWFLLVVPPVVPWLHCVNKPALVAGGRPTWDWAHDMAADGSISLTLRETPCGGASDSGGSSSSSDAAWWAQPADGSGRGSGNGSGRAHVSGVGSGAPTPSADGQARNGSSNGSSNGAWRSPGAGQQECDPSWLSSQL